MIGRSVLPLELILFVTDRCTFRCKHCFIKKFETDPGADISLDTVCRLADALPNLMVLMLTGGEPFLRHDLPELVRIFSVKSKPMVISIATNGFLSDRIATAVKEILSLPELNSQLILTISFEGLESEHNRNRDCSSAFENAMITAKSIKDLQGFYPQLSFGANITHLPENETIILDAANELANSGLFSFLTHNVYRELKPNSACNKIDLSVYNRLAQFTQNYSRAFNMSGNSILGKWHRYKERYQANLIEKTCKANVYQGLACEAGRGIAVVYSDGRVAPCELQLPDWGNINSRSFYDIWNDPANREASNAYRKGGCFCTHECFISASLNLQLAPMFSCLKWNLLEGRTRE